MPDDERTRRRLGDATKAKIADLADGWSTPNAGAADAPPAETAAPARKKSKTLPPPPPGSRERAALESQILDAKEATPTPVPVARSKPTVPPPVPPPRAKAPTQQVPTSRAPAGDPVIPLDQPKSGPLTSPRPAVAVSAARQAPSPTSPPRAAARKTMPPAIPAPAPATVVEVAPLGLQRGDDSLGQLASLQAPEPIALPMSGSGTGKLPTVPLGEFDDGSMITDDGKLRHNQKQAQHTMKRDAAEALLRMPPPVPPAPPKPPPAMDIGSISASLRGDPTAVEATYERGDPTAVSSGGVTQSSSVAGPASTLRAGAALRRKRGIAGDVRYVFTALFGVRRTRAELADLQVRQDTKQASRRRHLVTLGRTAMLSEYKHAAMDESRVIFESVEDERAGHAGQVAAADAELDRVRRDREASSKKNAAELAALDAELASLAKKLEPLDKEAATVQRRADALRDALAKIDSQIASTQNSLISVKGQRLDKAAVQAEVATLRADRQAVQRDEPIIAAELDTLQPRIAALRGQRAVAHQRRAEIVAAEEQDKKRIEELLTAIGAKRKVVDRAAAEAETARDNVLFQLGDKLYVDRPKKLAAQLAPIDAIDLELGEGARRIMELREILSNVDKTKLARGILFIVGVALVVGMITAWILMMALRG